MLKGGLWQNSPELPWRYREDPLGTSWFVSCYFEWIYIYTENPCRCMFVTHIGSLGLINASFLRFGVTSTHVSIDEKHPSVDGKFSGCEISRRVGGSWRISLKALPFLRMEKRDCSDSDPTTSKCWKSSYSYFVPSSTWNNGRICGPETLLN